MRFYSNFVFVLLLFVVFPQSISYAQSFDLVNKHLFDIKSQLQFLTTSVSGLFASPPSTLSEKTSILLDSIETNNGLQANLAEIFQSQNSQKIKNLVEDRERLLADLIEKNPAEVLREGLAGVLRKKFSKDVQSHIEEEVDIQGTLDVLNSDDFANNTSKFYYFLNTSSTQYSLYFADGEPRLLSGSNVKVHGIRVKNKIALADAKGKSFTTIFSKPHGHTVKKVAIVLVNFSNTIAPTDANHLADYYRQLVFTASSSVNAYYKESSFGNVQLVGKYRSDGDVYGWYTIPYSNTPCDFNTWADAANEALVAHGVDLNGYDNFIYQLNNANCPFSGIAQLGGSRAWIVGTGSSLAPIHVFAHEFGHNLGAAHANSYTCTNSQGAIVPLNSTCVSDEFGDPYEVMGGGATNHMNDFHKGQVNWFDQTKNIRTLSRGAVFTTILSPTEKLSTSTQSLRIPRDFDSLGNPSSYFYLEYRNKFGFDTFSNLSNVVQGISIRLAPNYNESVPSNLVNVASGTRALSRSALVPGQTFLDPVSGIGITALATSSQGIGVSVYPTLANCFPQAPNVQLSPLGQWTAPGGRLTYQVTLTNNNSQYCPPSDFIVSPKSDTPIFIYPSRMNLLSVAPGKSLTGTIVVSSTPSIGSGYYPFTVSASGTSTRLIGGGTPIPTTENSTQANYNVSSLASLISFRYPLGGESLSASSSQTILWQGGVNTWKLDLLLMNASGTQVIQTIATSTFNDGNQNWTTPSSIARGSYILRLVCRICDTQNTGLSTDSSQFILLGPADLFIPQLSINPNYPLPSSSIQVSTVILNQGGLTASTSMLSFNVAGKVSTTTIMSLLPGMSISVTRVLQAPTTPGSYELSVRADINQKVNESDESNNIKTATLIVGAPPSISILAPTSTGSFQTTANSITIGAIVTTNSQATVNEVGWWNQASGLKGSLALTYYGWLGDVPLIAGQFSPASNPIVIYATDSYGHYGQSSIIIYR